MAKSKRNGAKPDKAEEFEVVCNFDEVPRRWGVEWSEIYTREMGLNSALAAEAPADGLSEQEQRDRALERMEIVKELEAIPMRQARMIADVLVSVPSEATLSSTPEGVDWSNVDNVLDFIKQSRWADICKAITQARYQNSKN